MRPRTLNPEGLDEVGQAVRVRAQGVRGSVQGIH